MREVEQQVHGKFKLFAGELAEDGSIGALAGQAEAWVRSAKVAPKSIGIEYIEAAGRLLLTIGYRDDEPPYPVSLKSVDLGRVAKLGADELAGLEKAMQKASSDAGRVICHELYVTHRSGFHMVFMTYAA